MSAYSVRVNHPVHGAMDMRFHLDRDDRHEAYAYNFFAQNKFYEPDVGLLMIHAVKTGQFVIDVGANIGLFTILLAYLVGPEGIVLAVEPDAENLEKLRKNIELNELDNVVVLPVPLWRAEEEITFYKNLDNGGGHSLWDGGLWHGNTETQTQRPAPSKFMATTLEKEIAKIGRPCSLIKLDTEGADECVLSALGDNRPDYIISESNPFGMRQFGQDNYTMRTMMKEYGYDCFILSTEPEVPAMVPPNSDLVNSFDDRVVLNILYSTPENVGRAYPRVPHIVFQSGSK